MHTKVLMSPAEIAAHTPDSACQGGEDPLARARRRMRETGQWNPAQNMGRGWAIGCVALEITQRCNLDCTLCYLSESAEAIKDIPLEEVYHRIDVIRSCYGPGTNVQITGGEATLRRRDELIAIVQRTCSAGLRPALFTNGIRATRGLLEELCAAGLAEIAFHVDTTQKLKGFATEFALNIVRRRYIERARGLPLAVYFNTTVHDANFHEIPALVHFFVEHADVVRIASFQMQADTGRGIMGKRGLGISLDTVTEQIQKGTNTTLDFGALQEGHARCNRFAIGLVANGKVYDALDEREFVRFVLEKAAKLRLDRASWRKSLPIVLWWVLGETA
ncbi:MAG: radical SAM protein, partial [Burkholderiaceae bacterium]|nr:radical SAM protein [Burkholderiaceae bacterium]